MAFRHAGQPGVPAILQPILTCTRKREQFCRTCAESSQLHRLIQPHLLMPLVLGNHRASEAACHVHHKSPLSTLARIRAPDVLKVGPTFAILDVGSQIIACRVLALRLHLRLRLLPAHVHSGHYQWIPLAALACWHNVQRVRVCPGAVQRLCAHLYMQVDHNLIDTWRTNNNEASLPANHRMQMACCLKGFEHCAQ